jgi:hypothetical protein
MKRTFTLSAAAALALGAFAAHAGCVDPRAMTQNVSGRMPAFVMPDPGLSKSASADSSFNNGTAGDKIVGTWRVAYTTEGSPSGEAFIQWHSDGTEWENINFPILSGNICLGSWRRVDGRHVYRSHFGWLYTDGNLSGYFAETETNNVAHDGRSYSGVNDTKIYDLDGNLVVDLAGTSEAVRISP